VTVLVVVASKYGATRGIADRIGHVLGGHGIDVRVADVAEVTSVAPFDGVVLGSAVYAGRWLRAARAFAQDQASALRSVPVWLFSSGPIGDPPRPEPDEAVDVREVVALLEPREHRVFAGELVKGRLGFPERAVVRAFRAAEGDFRDWDEIEAWAGRIAAELRAPELAGVR
jgi:menaquinone-dependent protoporphyrinogen oxidase